MAPLSEEEENYVRLVLFLKGVAPRAVRTLFDREFPPIHLPSTLNTNYNTLDDLKFKRIVNQAQWNLLFPRNDYLKKIRQTFERRRYQSKTNAIYMIIEVIKDFHSKPFGVPDSKTFDVTLMICLIRNLTSVIPAINGFDSLPLPAQTTPGSDLARIKYYRNKLAHYDSNTIDTAYFNTAWTDISDAVGRLGGQAMYQECQELKVKILDQSNQEVILEIKQSLEEMKELRQQMDNLGKEHSKVTDNLRELQDSHITLQTSHSSLLAEHLKVTKMLKDPIPWNIRGQIEHELETWEADDKTYIETNAARSILKCIKEKGYVIVTASSGCGKSSLVRHVALQMQKDGFDVLPVTNPNDIITWYNPKKETLFVVDDFCGTYTLNPIKYENWKSCVQKINTLVEKQHVKLIMSCRLQVYRDEQIKTLSLFQPCECNLLTENLRLSKSEKQSIAKFYLKEKASKIKGYYDTFDCFPLLCQLYHKNSKLNVVDFFKNPFTVYKEEIDNLQTEGAHGKYCALALCVMFNNCLKEEWLTEDVDKDIKKVIKNTYERCKVVKGTSRLVLRDELDSLSHTFIRKEGNIYRTIHDKLFDFLAFYFGSVMIQSLIKNATNRLIRERFLFEEKSTSDEFTIIVPERYQQIYIKRMVDDWSNGNIEDVFCNINMNNQIFRQRFLLHIKGLKILQQKQLASTSDTHNNSTPLLQCCFKGDIELVKWCLHHCLSNVNLCRIGGASPLFMACQEGHTDVVLLLINNKADVDICNNKVVSPLNIACQKGHTDVVKTLIHNSADINKCGESGTSPLFMACQRGLTEVVQTLINKKADINECIATGASPLFVACQQGHADVVQMLIDNKADINRCHYNEASPLYMSSQLGHTEIVQMLINKKADVNKCYETGASPLFIACQQGHTEIAQMLINNKADINKCDNEKLSPLYMACQKGHTEIVQMLIKNNPATSNNYFPIKTLLKPK